MEDLRETVTGLSAISAREMRQLYSKVQTLEDVVHTIFERGTKPSRQECQSLQDFDLVMQTLAGLAGFFERVESQVLDNGHPDIAEATQAVTLQKLRERLQEIGNLVDS
ncbi:hypothetical protein RSK20926_01597 [Roseobacter sp. SK209-2-6]|uniref:hypothetical protein n=1 Tax=Roseobacter sp. SK209-2-6 TaxID=388739 RepID=UPI0000F3F539|nr:hypothetical protein [Roseobacter sp. SK209-2-6]EBA14680.1 hypothetical protein RSK20926_01597 [Roseobacter sp. SK209-2-6]